MKSRAAVAFGPGKPLEIVEIDVEPPPPLKWMRSTLPASPLAVAMKVSQVHVATCRVPTRPTCVTQLVTKCVPTPLSETKES